MYLLAVVTTVRSEYRRATSRCASNKPRSSLLVRLVPNNESSLDLDSPNEYEVICAKMRRQRNEARLHHAEHIQNSRNIRSLSSFVTRCERGNRDEDGFF